MMTANFLDPLLVPMVVGGSALLAMASLRNSDIANRLRSCIKELRDGKGKITPCREHCLNKQINLFNKRYLRLSLASAFFLVSLAFFIVSAITEKAVMNLEEYYIILGLTISVLFLIFGLVILMIEFFEGHKTLDLEYKDIEKNKLDI